MSDTPSGRLFKVFVLVGLVIFSFFIATHHIRNLPEPPGPEPYVVHERPQTTVDMVVGLADLLVKERARADRLEAERDAILDEAEAIIRNLTRELNRRGHPRPTPAIPNGNKGGPVPPENVIVVPVNPC